MKNNKGKKEKTKMADIPKPNFKVDLNPLSSIKKVIGIVSGKGGVGKSTVTSELAVALNRAGKKVGIMDADITGPSIPKAFGITKKARGSEQYFYPVASKQGIDIISMNLLLENDTDPVIWRGPVIAGAVKQFWTDVVWGDKDVLLIDMPPGTGDVPLTIFQSLPVDGIVIVTSPQDLVSMVVEKAVNMAKMMNVNVTGIIENYSYFQCPNCGEKVDIFGKSHIDEISKEKNVKLLGKMPIDPDIAMKMDQGKIEEISDLSNLNDAIAELL